jgi:hypothetical protein
MHVMPTCTSKIAKSDLPILLLIVLPVHWMPSRPAGAPQKGHPTLVRSVAGSSARRPARTTTRESDGLAGGCAGSLDRTARRRQPTGDGRDIGAKLGRKPTVGFQAFRRLGDDVGRLFSGTPMTVIDPWQTIGPPSNKKRTQNPFSRTLAVPK